MSKERLTTVGRLTKSGVLSERPCTINSICAIGLAETSNVYTVYDGHDTTGKLKFRMVAGSYTPDFRLYCPPLYFDNGIYVEFTTNGEEICFQYLQLVK